MTPARGMVLTSVLAIACGQAAISPAPTSTPVAPAGAPGAPPIVSNPNSDAGAGTACGPSIEGEGTGRRCPPDAAPPPPPPPASPVPPPSDPLSIDVRAWGATNTGVYLRAGETASITATGRWRMLGGAEVGPEGQGGRGGGGCARGALVARVAKFHQRTCIGASGSITANRDGYLWLFQSEGWNAVQSKGTIQARVVGGTRNTGHRPEGLTPLAEDPKVDPAHVRSFASVCGPQMIPVHFEAENPDDPRVRAYVSERLGGDPAGTISRWVVNTCAVFYPTPAEFPKHFRDRRVRIVHYIYGQRRWDELNRPPLRNARGEHWDFTLEKSLAEISVDQADYGPHGGGPVSIMHEVGHLLSPGGGGGKTPKWLEESIAETAPSHLGGTHGFHHAIDNPESVRWGARWWWCDGTFGGPTFVNYIEERHPGFLHAVTRASLRIGERNPWPGSDAVFRPITGKSLDELWTGYVAYYGFTPPRDRPTVAECMDPRE